MNEGTSKKVQRYRMDLNYLGHHFNGFQAQPCGNTIQDHLEAALQIILRHPVRIKGASRTDSGVHAHHQVVTFSTALAYNPRWLVGLNAVLPNDIGVFSIREVPDEFDPIYSAKAKAYRYRIWKGKCFNPFLRPFVWSVNPSLDVTLLKQSLSNLMGVHDFAGFSNQGGQVKTTQRKIIEVYVDERQDMIDVWIIGEGFLKQMVRIIVGTMVDIATGQLPATQVSTVLSQGLRSLAGVTAPARGLSLVEIFYNEVPSIISVISNSEQGVCTPLFKH